MAVRQRDDATESIDVRVCKMFLSKEECTEELWHGHGLSAGCTGASGS